MINSNTLTYRNIINTRTLFWSTMSLACAFLVGLSAWVRIPMPGTPVPVTLQTFALLASAGVLGRYYAVQMAAWYILLGLAGLPFFSGGSGLAHLASPTGGYIAGFLMAAGIVGFLDSSSKRWYARMLVFIIATIAIYVPGLVQLHLATGFSLRQTVATGFIPFIIYDIIKALAAWRISSAIRH